MGRSRRKQLSDDDALNSINQELIESGERDRLRMKLYKCLENSSWRDEVKLQAREIINEKGANNINMEDLVQELVTKATLLVPDKVRKDLSRDVQDVLDARANQ